ncbi:MAG: hypothetical protein HY694_18585 [Deltaproteobacteria bacterium]|nr:hypothetical protein [Deltaproteobacteria bacterium]
MYLTTRYNLGDEEVERSRPGRQPLPYREAMEETERKLFDEYTRACAGVRLLEWLTREPMSPLDQVRFWEKVLRWLPKIFELKRELDRLVREGRISRAVAVAILNAELYRVFPRGYALGTEQDELARARCALSKARWEFFAQQHRGKVPGRRLLQRR